MADSWRQSNDNNKSLDIRAATDDRNDTKEVDINQIYTHWSRWSRCSRKCKQRRERRCAVPSICGSAVVKMERGCHSDRCRGRDFHIVRKRKKLGRKTKNQMKRNKAFYSKWTRWSQCTNMCLTTRVKSCRYPSVCGNVQVAGDILVSISHIILIKSNWSVNQTCF